MTDIISPNRAIFLNVALQQTFFPITARDFSCSVIVEPLIACRPNSLSRIKLELVLTFLFTSCIGISRLRIRIPSELFFWRTLLSKQGNCLSRPSLDLLQVDLLASGASLFWPWSGQFAARRLYFSSCSGGTQYSRLLSENGWTAEYPTTWTISYVAGYVVHRNQILILLRKMINN